MENTLENKAKFFALYLDQEVYCIEVWNRGVMICDAHKLIKEDFNYLKKSFLELKPLSSISDEDAVEWIIKTSNNLKSREDLGVITAIKRYDTFISIESIDKGVRFKTLRSLHHWDGNTHRISANMSDFLRSKGYALPWMGLSVEEQVNRGWVKLKGETK